MVGQDNKSRDNGNIRRAQLKAQFSIQAMQMGKHELSRVRALIALCLVGTLAGAEEVQHLRITVPGGLPGLPVMTGIERTITGAKVTWDGPSGYYQLYQQLGLTSPTWQKVGGPNLNRTTNVTTLHSNAFFRVSGPAPQYAGSQACLECHESVHSDESNTQHARALEALKPIHQDKNPSCLPCHTVGYGLPTGFISETTTPQLAGVQCENCHGPAGNHAANPGDLTARPRMDIASQVCGGCHNGPHSPTFDEWKSSGHFAVVEDMNPPGRINSCGRCHSGTARLAMVNGLNPGNTVTNDANVGITCAVCHDPHATHAWTNVVTGIAYTNQLRYPLASTNYYSLSTSAPFTNRYDINVCAQCHNDRGAAWTTTSRPPHHSPQYNMLLATVGVLPAGVTGEPAAHAGTKFLSDSSGRSFLVTNQCVTCHMPTGDYQHDPPEVAAVPGHSFQVTSYAACVDCHGSGANAEGLVDLVHGFIANQIQQVKVLLDTWATTKAPIDLRSKYGPLAWEYTVPGELSTGIAGPTTAEQTQIPDNIKKARFDLYLVLYDGSYGVHNGPYAFTLLDSARNWVQLELNQ